ncbi:MAG: hypothetical protein NTW86_03800 [Candidatus Sumerlaeota bacterium]|nr:hypothetical protein [Candidatus Sumerlaeota bacterium]
MGNSAKKETSARARQTAILRAIFDAAFERFGPRHWWPGETDEEIVIGAVLTQNTAWANVEKAIANLREARMLSLKALDRAGESEVAQRIRPAGYYNLKARRLKALARFLVERCDGNLSRLRHADPAALRADLLQVYGVGPETADSILLYALSMPIFVIDAYTRRILARHGLARPNASYDELQKLFQSNLAPDAPYYNEYHALLVAVGHRHCKPTPRCADCPLYRAALFATRRSHAEAQRHTRPEVV